MLETLSLSRAFGGQQGVYRHQSTACGVPMTFSVFVPPHAPGARLPVLWFLSGLTCSHANVTDKGEFRRACADRGIIFVAPDTSPRGDVVADDPAYDLGQGAGFYLDATQAPWASHFQMRSYVEDELPEVIAANFAMADLQRQGITGHSMGGHGALTIALRNAGRYASVSAFAPIVAPTEVPWGHKAFSNYLGNDRPSWRGYDACALIADGARSGPILVDQGEDDPYLAEQLQPERLAAACTAAVIDLTLRMRPGYDHSYAFVSTFMAEHIDWHSALLHR